MLGACLLGTMLGVWAPNLLAPVLALVALVGIHARLSAREPRAALRPAMFWADWGPYDGSVWFGLHHGSAFGRVLYLLGLCAGGCGGPAQVDRRRGVWAFAWLALGLLCSAAGAAAMTAVSLPTHLPVHTNVPAWPLLSASWRVVRPGRVLLPAGVALLLVAATWPWLDDGYAGLVLHGVTLLLACTMALTCDDPGAEVVAATPVPPLPAHPGPPRRRSRRRCCPAYAVAVVADSRLPTVSLTAHTVEAAVVGSAAAAIGVASGRSAGHCRRTRRCWARCC